MINFHYKCLAITVLAVLVHGLPKKYEGGKEKKGGGGGAGFVPSAGHFQNFPHNNDQIAMETSRNTTEADATNERPARFGFPTYSTDVQGYAANNGVVPGLYGPVKLDIGGLVIGTIVGLGAFFILPKLLSVISPPYGGGYKRSEEEGEESRNIGITELMNRVSDSLAKYNIDSTACLQRALCSYIQTTSDKVAQKNGNTFDNIVDTVSRNDMVRSYLDGTAWRPVVDTVHRGDKCNVIFSKCPFGVETVLSQVKKYMSY